MKLRDKLNTYGELATQVAAICHPLQSLGIVGFFYIRVYENGEFADLTSGPECALLPYVDGLLRLPYGITVLTYKKLTLFSFL